MYQLEELTLLRSIDTNLKTNLEGNANITGDYKINSITVLSENSLGLGVTNSSLTTVGTLTDLTVDGGITGTLLTAAQPNITSLGTLSGLGVSNNIFTLNGNIGVGTIDPDFSLNIVSTGDAAIMIENNDSDADAEIHMKTPGHTDNDTRVLVRSKAGDLIFGDFGDTNTGDLIFRTAGSTAGLFQADQDFHLYGDCNLNVDGKSYRIDNSIVLSENSLGLGVTGSSLTTLGTLDDLTVVGDVDITGNLSASGFVAEFLSMKIGPIEFPTHTLSMNGSSIFNGAITIGTTGVYEKPLEITLNSGGVVFPKLTTVSRDSMDTTLKGEMIFNDTTNSFQGWTGVTWVNFH